MKKTLTKQWREGTLPLNHYYVKTKNGRYGIDNTVLTFDEEKPITKLLYSDYTEEVLAPVPSYRQLYGANDGNIPVGLFTVLKLIKRDIEQYQKIRNLTDLECGIKSQVVSLLKRHDCDLGKDGLVNNPDELKKKLKIATKALKDISGWDEYDCMGLAKKALKEMEGVK